MRSYFPEYSDTRPIVPFKSIDWLADSVGHWQSLNEHPNATKHKYRKRKIAWKRKKKQKEDTKCNQIHYKYFT